MSARLFVPTPLFSPAAVELFEAEGAEVVWGLPRAAMEAAGPERIGAVEGEIEAELERRLEEIDALFAIVMYRQLEVSAELLARAPRLRVVFVPSAGTDAIDVEAASAHGVAVVSAPGNNLVAVAESTVGMILAAQRKIVLSDRLGRAAGRAATLAELGGPPGIVRGKTVGLVGFGFTGREIGRICGALGMEVLAHDPFADPVEARRLGVEPVHDLEELLARADFVSLHCPLTAATRGIIGAAELAAMKPTAVLVNTSRGPTVDTAALVAALRAGEIAAAALDVTDPEPLPAGHELFALDNAFLTPHLAGVAPELLPAAVETSTRGALAVLRGERPRNLVNPAAELRPGVAA